MENENSLIQDADDISLQSEYVTSAKPTTIFTTGNENYSKDSFFLFKELLDGMRWFSWTDNYSVYAFLWDVEDNFSIIPKLSEAQKIIGIKNLIFGVAKICISGNRNLLTYSAIKQALIEEFGEKFSSIDLHRQL